MLQLLTQYAESHGLTAEPGFKPKQVRWAIVANTTGEFLNTQELGQVGSRKNKGETFPKCPDLTQPEMKRGGAGCRHFLVDTAEVVALLSDDPDDPKLLAKHAYFTGLLRQASSAVPELTRLAAMVDDDEALSRIRGHLVTGGAKPTDNVSFAIVGRDPIHIVSGTDWYAWWRAFRASFARSVGSDETADPNLMRCFASGELVQPAQTHPKIEGLTDVGGIAMGDALVSFKQDSFCSYGLVQSNNAAVSEEMASAYRASLNDLIRNHSRRFAGVRVLHWYVGKTDVPEDIDPVQAIDWPKADETTDDDSDEVKSTEASAQRRASRFLEAFDSGELEDLLNYRYCMLTLAGAAGRVMIRDWVEGQFGELAENVVAWFKHLEIVRRDGSGLTRRPKFMAVLGSLVRELKDLPAPLVTAMWNVAVRKERIPEQALAQALARFKTDIVQDNPANHARMGLMKAFWIRSYNSEEGDGIMTSYLNEEHPEPAYQFGRLMAVYADLQYAALGNVGAGVVQRYYAAASATPSLVMGRLDRLSQFHIGKLMNESPGLANWFETRKCEILSRIDPDKRNDTLSLQQQSLFALGYYQQKAAKNIQSVPAEETQMKKQKGDRS